MEFICDQQAVLLLAFQLSLSVAKHTVGADLVSKVFGREKRCNKVLA